MRGSIRLEILAGTTLKPLAAELLQGFVSGTVEVGSSGSAGFDLQFELPLRAEARTVFFPESAPKKARKGEEPERVRLSLALLMGVRREPLIDGVVTFVQSKPSGAGSLSMTVRGRDATARMERQPESGRPLTGTASERAKRILAKYEPHGVTAEVVAERVEQHRSAGHGVPQQQGTDYEYLMQLAEDAGYVFYIDPEVKPGQSKAYWGPEVRVGRSQPVLTTNMDAFNTVEEIDFSFDPERNEEPEAFAQQPGSRRFQRVAMGSEAVYDRRLGRWVPTPRLVLLPDTALLHPSEVGQRARAHARRHRDVVTGHGRLDVARYGRVLRSRRPVDVRGAGPFNGQHYVTRVTYEISRGACLQSFELARDAVFPNQKTVQLS